MDEISKTSTPEYPALVPGRWVGLLVAAVVLAEAIWGLLVSLTNNLFLPLMAKVIGGDPQSPLYLGKGDLNVPALFSSVLGLCLAGIVFVLLNHWSRRRPAPVRVKTVRMGKTVSQATAQPLSITPSPAPSVAPNPSFGFSTDSASKQSIACTTNAGSCPSTTTNNASDFSTGPCKTGKAQAAQRGLLQHCRRTHKPDGRRVA